MDAPFELEVGPDFTNVRIPTPRSTFAIVFVPFWLCCWLAAEILVAGVLLRVWPERFVQRGAGADSPFALLWLVGWTVGGITMLRAWLMQLRGEEVVHIANGTLRIRRGIGKRGRVAVYAVHDISELRVISRGWHERLFNDQWNRMFRPTLVFRCGGRDVRFAYGLEEGAAGEMLCRLVERCPALK